VHDVVEGIFIGNVASENASDRDTSDDTSFIRNLRQGQSDLVARKLIEAGDVVTIIDVDASVDWNFRSEAAAWKRIVMNLFGNAMKFTKKGQVSVKLYLARAESDTRETIRLEIHDTGTGIDKDYLQSHLFTAFSQADDISVGTGVGLSIVKRLVEELDGSIDVQSDKGIGTRVNVAIPLGEMTFPVNGLDSLLRKKAPLYANGRHQGHTLYVQGPASSVPKGERDDPAVPSATAFANADTNMSTFFANLARKGFGMGVVELATPGDDQHQSDGSAHSIYLDSSTSGGAWTLWRHDGGAGDNGADGGSAAAGESKCIVVSIRQPFGPRTLASALDEIMAFTTDTANAPVATKTEENKRKPDTQPPSPSRMSPTEDDKQALLSDSHDGPTAVARETYDTTASPRNQSPPAAENPLSTPKSGPHLLLVDDNAVNLKVLAASVKRGGCTYDQAADGRQAVEAYKSNASAYDLVFMDLSMPVLDGIEATRQIRALEEESGAGLEKRTRIIALTALGDDRHRQRAFEAGVDDFITKPVKMARARELARLAWDG
jgi:CheY-like chemotaxis protein/anti-sigma regulatory factor (Ser/Thr protein kinase)